MANYKKEERKKKWKKKILFKELKRKLYLN
jgi:hypothetical protein